MRFGLSVNFHVPPGSGMNEREAYATTLDTIVLAEQLGFRSAIVAEHHFFANGWCPSPLMAAAVIAGRTSSMHVGAGILILPLYQPIRLAEDIAVLDVLSDGRTIVGVGMGYREDELRAFGGRRGERLGRFVEGLDVLTELLSGRELTYAGDHVRCEGVRITPTPIQRPHPPIWIGANAERAIRRAASRGMPLYLGNQAPLGILARRWAIYEDELEALGGGSAPLERPLMREMYVAASWDEAWRDAGQHVERIYRRDLIEMGFGVPVIDDDGEEVQITDPLHAALEPRRLVADRILLGTPADCVEQIERCRQQLGTDHLLLRIDLGLDAERIRASLELFAREVIPAFP